MAYKSQVTNKYMGSGFKGAPKSNTTTELTQIVKALKEDFNPAFKNYVDTYIDKKQDDAAIKVQGLYASGMTADAISKEILDGKHPDLEGKYVKAVVDGYAGTFEAGEVIKKINEAKAAGDYSIEDGISIETFWKGHLPKFTDKSSAWTTGFATIFNKYRATELQEDAKLRGAFRESKKVEGIHGVIDAHIITENAAKKKVNGSDLWAIVNSYIGKLPKVDGYKENVFISKETANNAMYEYAYKLWRDAETQEELEIAKSILYDKRVDIKGNTLDSLFKIGKKEVVDLVGSIETKMITLENQRVQKEEREWVLQRRDGLVELFLLENGSEEFKKKRDALVALHPDLQDDIQTIIKYNAMASEDSGKIADITNNAINGEYNYKEADLKEALNDANATSETRISIYKSVKEAERYEMNGWQSPYNDTRINNLVSSIADVLQKKMPVMAKYDSGKGAQILSDLVEFDVRREYIAWLKNNKRPDANSTPADHDKWEIAKQEFIEKTYNDKIKLYDNKDWKETLKNIIMLDSENDDFDLDDVPTEYYDEIVKSTIKEWNVKDSEGKTGFAKLIETADRDLMPLVELIQKDDRFKKLISSSGFQAFLKLDKTGASAERIAQKILQDAGIVGKDYTEALIQAADTINSFVGEGVILPEIQKDDFWSFKVDEKQESIDARKKIFKDTLTSIIGRDATQGLLVQLQKYQPEIITTLAQAFNLSTEDFGNLINKEGYLQ